MLLHGRLVSNIGNRIPNEQGKRIFSINDRIQTRQNRDNTHENDKKEEYTKTTEHNANE
jgi:hypothetical protein